MMIGIDAAAASVETAAIGLANSTPSGAAARGVCVSENIIPFTEPRGCGGPRPSLFRLPVQAVDQVLREDVADALVRPQRHEIDVHPPAATRQLRLEGV